MQFNPPAKYNILTCPVCNSTGYVKFRRCPQCKGMSMGIFNNGKFLYWGEALNKYHIRLRKGRRLLNKFRILGAIIFGFGFLALFFWQIYKLDAWLNLFNLSFWSGTYNQNLILFWLSVLSFSYLFYRIILLGREPEVVDFKEYKIISRDVEERVIDNWQQAAKLAGNKRKDISAVLTNDAKLALEESYHVAEKFAVPEFGSVPLFYALLSSWKVASVFIRLGISAKTLQAHIAKSFTAKEKKQPLIGDDLRQILFNSYNLAYEIRQEYVNVTELLVSVVNQSPKIQELLYDLNVDGQKLLNVVEWLRIRERLHRQYQKFQKAASRRNKYGLDRAMTAVATPYLNSFGQDLTMAAKYGYLNPCVAREQEILEIFRIIEGGRQSVLLVGNRGVGKMSLIEGITQKMIEDEVPGRLKDKRLVQLSTSALLAGTTVSGAQERLIRIMNEVARANNIILFIKNIHDLVGATDSGSEGLDMSETLAEYLGKGRFLCLATTNSEDFNRTVSNKEIGSVFTKVEIKEMNENQAVQVLQSKVGVVEYKHDVFFSYNSLAQSVKLAKKFLNEQSLPESAIRVMTETAAFVHQNKGASHLVTAEDVGVVISQKTGVPTTTVSEDEGSKLLRLEEEMHKRVIGQNEAVQMIANALRRARAEIRSTKKPIASFLFLGPTGVGKTELAKTIAEIYFGGENRMVRIDMSEYQDKSSIYRLIGEPGRQGTGILTEAVRQNPFSLVLLDELEKADPDVLNLFLQVFDDGRLTDSIGRVIDFTNTIIIATSNAGTTFVQEQVRAGVDTEKIRQSLIRDQLKQYYRPEFLNRFDGIILFKPLDREAIKKIASLMLKRVGKDLEARGVGLQVETAGLDYLADIGFDPDFGARPMRRAIQDKIENKLAELVLRGELERRDTVVVGVGAEVRVDKAR